MVTARAGVQAGAHVEDLRTRCAYFYEVALRLAALAPLDGLSKLVTGAFRARYKVTPAAVEYLGMAACPLLLTPAGQDCL